MTRRIAYYGKASFTAGWTLATVLTTLWERGHLALGFWPAVLVAVALGYGMAVAQDHIARRLVSREAGEGS